MPAPTSSSTQPQYSRPRTLCEPMPLCHLYSGLFIIGVNTSSIADSTNRRVRVAKMPFQSPGGLDSAQNSARFSVSKDPNVRSAKLVLISITQVFLLDSVIWMTKDYSYIQPNGLPQHLAESAAFSKYVAGDC